jgi:uncharacterized protein YbjT (DUF2867 family)
MTTSLKNRILVTGASGTISSQLAKQLSISRASFRMGVHSKDSKKMLSEIKGVDFVEMDYSKSDTISRACNDVDSVFLLISGPRALEYVSTFVNEAKKAEVKHIVKITHFRAESSPGVTITRLHRQVEKVIEESGINYTFLRPNSYMQNFC